MQLFDQHHIDRLFGLGENRSAIQPQATPVFYTGTSVYPVVDDDDVLTLQVDGNVIASAQLTVEIVYALGA